MLLVIILMVKKLLEHFMQLTNQEKFRTEKVIKRTGNKVYIKWKGYNNSFNRWIEPMIEPILS